MRIQIIETGLGFNSPMPRTSTTGLVIHHTGDNDVDLSAAEIHAMHLANGWSGIGYHFVVRKDGTVERGRPEWAMGAHAPGANGWSLGVHVCGSFSAQLPNEAQLQSLVALLADKCEEYGIDPFSGIAGHRDMLATECPGEMLYNYLPQIRQRVSEALSLGVA